MIGLAIEAVQESPTCVRGRVGRERARGRDVCYAERALIEHAPAIGEQRDHARHVLALNRTTQGRVHARDTRRLLRTRRAGQPSNEDAHADDHSNYLPIHESLPADSSPGCRLAPSGQPAATAMADPTIARLNGLARFAKTDLVSSTEFRWAYS